MAQYVLNDLHVDSGLAKPGSTGVAQGMAAKLRKQDKVLRLDCTTFAFCQLFLVAVADDTVNAFIDGAVMLALAKTVYKNKIPEYNGILGSVQTVPVSLFQHLPR